MYLCACAFRNVLYHTLIFTKLILISLRPTSYFPSRFPTTSFSILHSSLATLPVPTLSSLPSYQLWMIRERTKPYYSQNTSWVLSSSISSQPQCTCFFFFFFIPFWFLTHQGRHYRSLFQSHENFFSPSPSFILPI